MNSNTNYLTISSLILLLFGCKKDPGIPQPTDGGQITIVYLEANNDLKSEAHVALNQLEQGLIGLDQDKGTVLAYIKDNSEKAYLLKMMPDNDALIVNSDTLKTFDLKSSSLADQVSEVLRYVKSSFMDKRYNLVLWSHGTSWAPATNSASKPRVKSFGEDRGMQMDIKDLSKALPMKFNYIIFDACSMASIEVLYEFKDVADLIIASPTDVLSDGFPYHNIVIDFLSDEEGAAINIARKYFDFYRKRSGLFRSATVSVTDLNKIDSLPAMFYAKKGRLSEHFTVDDVQRFDFTAGFPIPLYDLTSLVRKNFDFANSEQLEKAIDKAILYKANTSHFIGNPITEYSGVAITAIAEDNVLYPYYQSLNWWRAAH
ncbi:clostripain-related cysteine peptidase [Sphingobacterium deserti]|uniref:Peptidase C11 clostripain n=1 Tax=Sphingobacterium deserti TaxID=1229276 RepID=A0A0B8T1F2_9SPHI|nr:clostripain-related cysteine peptidase [Sphingobacterium deserti]KGE14752.1 hypothetical protein DI53_1781 [Sphingobacterium deserti]